MTFLNFDDSNPSSGSGKTSRSVKKPLRLILGIGALAGVIALGSTLAANIGINTGAPIEFGQGVAQTTACSGTTPITVLPTSSFVNAPGAAGDFYFTSLTISNIPNSCVGRQFSISAFGKSGNPLKLTKCSDIGTTPVIKFMGNSETSYTADSLADMYTRVTNKTSTSFTVDWDSGSECGGSATTLAKNVYNITIESATGSSIWDGITWTESTEAGPLRYADSLTGDQPVWLRDTKVSLTAGSAFEYGSSSKGLHIIGDANTYGYPYITDFTIPEAQKVTVQFTFYHNSQCSDQGVILFSDGTLPAWVWGYNSSGFAAQFDCENPVLNTMDASDSGSNILTIGQAYIGILTYDPSLVSDANLTFVTKTLTGETLDTRRLWGTLPVGFDYRVGISADPDGDTNGLPAYFKNLIITIG